MTLKYHQGHRQSHHVNAVVWPCMYKKAQLTQGLRATAPSFQDGCQPPSWIL